MFDPNNIMALAWWFWLVLGCAFLVLEIATPGGFYVFFFGIGAILVGMLAGLGIAGPAWMQWMLFGIISTTALLIFRKPLQKRLGTPDRDIDTMVGETALALVDLGIDGVGQVELRGTVWTARNAGVTAIITGQRCRVERVEGLTLHIRG